MNGGETARICQAVLGAGEDEIQPDVFELAKDMLQLDAARESPMTLPTADEPPRDDGRGADLLAKSVNESNRIRATLQGLVQSSRLRRPVHKRAGNRMDGNRLFRIAVGDARVFVRHAPSSLPTRRCMVSGQPSHL